MKVALRAKMIKGLYARKQALCQIAFPLSCGFCGRKKMSMNVTQILLHNCNKIWGCLQNCI
ncbi:MAG: hypothetical protein MUO63_16190, partial [Desulfobulbaceae bacterium]|nr:hypothetical protein [Desulfobulbaceae bacterium]